MRWRGVRAQALAACALVWFVTPVVTSAVPPRAMTPARVGTIALGWVPGAPAAAAQTRERPPAALAGTVRHVVRWRAGGVLRELVDVAPRVAAHRPLPLVVVLHGRWQTPWRAERMEGWDRYAARGQAVIAYGAGYGGSWNAGWCCGAAQRARLDDVAYVVAAIRREERRHVVDRRRVFLVGFSNGGMLAYDVACTHADLLSGLAVVAGSLETATCRPARALNVIDVEGDHDRVVPDAGSPYSPVAGAPIRPVADSLRPWLRLANTRFAVRLVRLAGIGHEWPTVRDGQWDATSQIWHFLLTRPPSVRAA